jgi:hypothetical protein
MSRLSLQERELEPENNIFIINSSSNTITKTFTIGLYQVGLGWVSGHFGFWVVSGRVGYRVIQCRVISGYGSYQVGSGRVLGHLVSGHFGFLVVSGQSGRVSGHLVLGHFGFWVVLCWIGSGIRSFSVRLFQILNCIRSGQVERVSRIGSDSARNIMNVIASVYLIIYQYIPKIENKEDKSVGKNEIC